MSPAERFRKPDEFSESRIKPLEAPRLQLLEVLNSATSAEPAPFGRRREDR